MCIYTRARVSRHCFKPFFRMIPSLFPASHSRVMSRFEAYRQVTLGFIIVELFFGNVLGSMLGWQKKIDVPNEATDGRAPN